MRDFFVLFLVAFIAGWAASTVHKWVLDRRLFSLECDVADLQDKILSEIKKRASMTFAQRQHSKDEQLILEAAKSTSLQPANDPWWMPYIGKRT